MDLFTNYYNYHPFLSLPETSTTRTTLSPLFPSSNIMARTFVGNEPSSEERFLKFFGFESDVDMQKFFARKENAQYEVKIRDQFRADQSKGQVSFRTFPVMVQGCVEFVVRDLQSRGIISNSESAQNIAETITNKMMTKWFSGDASEAQMKQEIQNFFKDGQWTRRDLATLLAPYFPQVPLETLRGILAPKASGQLNSPSIPSSENNPVLTQIAQSRDALQSATAAIQNTEPTQSMAASIQASGTMITTKLGQLPAASAFRLSEQGMNGRQLREYRAAYKALKQDTSGFRTALQDRAGRIQEYLATHSDIPQSQRESMATELDVIKTQLDSLDGAVAKEAKGSVTASIVDNARECTQLRAYSSTRTADCAALINAISRREVMLIEAIRNNPEAIPQILSNPSDPNHKPLVEGLVQFGLNKEKLLNGEYTLDQIQAQILSHVGRAIADKIKANPDIIKQIDKDIAAQLASELGLVPDGPVGDGQASWGGHFQSEPIVINNVPQPDLQSLFQNVPYTRSGAFSVLLRADENAYTLFTKYLCERGTLEAQDFKQFTLNLEKMKKQYEADIQKLADNQQAVPRALASKYLAVSIVLSTMKGKDMNGLETKQSEWENAVLVFERGDISWENAAIAFRGKPSVEGAMRSALGLS